MEDRKESIKKALLIIKKECSSNEDCNKCQVKKIKKASLFLKYIYNEILCFTIHILHIYLIFIKLLYHNI